MFDKIRKWFNKEINSKPIRKCLVTYVYATEDAGDFLSYVTDVKVFQEKNGIRVEITTHRPGILIGKQGSRIDAIKKFAEDKFKQEVKINIKECELFQNLYN